MKKRRLILQGLLVWGAVLCILWIFLIATSLIPNEFLKDKFLESAYTIAQTDMFSYHDGSKMNGMADNYADSIWLNVAWYMGKDTPLMASVDTKYYDGGNGGEKEGLYLAIVEEDRKPNTDYTRYWHGTAGVIRFLHLFTDVNGIRIIGFLTIIGLAMLIMCLLIHSKKDILAICFFLSLCMVKVWNVRLSMEYQPTFIIGFLICALYLLYEKKGDRDLILLAVVSGTSISFFDFLTTETIGIILPLILVIAVRCIDERSGDFINNIKFILNQGIAWITAYGITFLAKWSIASVVTENNKFDLALNVASERIGGINSGTLELHPLLQKLSAPAANLSVWLGGNKRLSVVHISMGIGFILLYAIIVILCLKHGRKEHRDVIKVLAILGSIIIVRYFVLNNHSYMHAFFTYRGMINMFMALYSILIISKNKKVII